MIYELHYDNTNTYVISAGKDMLMFDTGWAGTFMQMCGALGEQELKLQEIKYLVISHFHPDHMGLAGELMKQGITVIAMESQKACIHACDHIFQRDKRFVYTPLEEDRVQVLSFAESREFLQKLGIDGEIIPTPGHSDDSISLILDSGDVFVGDLYPLYELDAHEEPGVQESWQKILERKPKRIYYGHAKTAVLEEVASESSFTADRVEIGEDGLKNRRANDQSLSVQKNAHLHDTVKKIMHLIDKGVSIDKIASKLKVEKDFVSDVCRMYLTHRNVGVQGILDRIEIKGK
ncbi:MAG: MBL fold metallo-hydrolase [Lachnospiraceae bacterium]|nr:MBL fold metallo-hydrolase [Lachnospiraceae bacterium]MBQ7832625.1 MBL fold metallo-hydrolase [Lachnospiraceae bacterium]